MKGQNTDNQKVWFITGASSHLGLALVKQALGIGHRGVAACADSDSLRTAMQGHPGNFLPIDLDLDDEIAVELAIDQAVRHFGRIDIVVNNAGYRSAGEKWTKEASRENFYTNIFGSLNVVEQALPLLREQHSGHIINISSVPGFLGSLAMEEAAAGIKISHYPDSPSPDGHPGIPEGAPSQDAEAVAILRLVQDGAGEINDSCRSPEGEMYTAAGFTNIKTGDSKQAPGLDIHEMGGVRMGTARAADHIFTALKKGEV